MKLTKTILGLAMGSGVLLAGCGPVDVDFSKIQKPKPADELKPLDRFVGNWTWQAERSTGDGAVETWNGQASWKWVLGDMQLYGDLSVSGPTSFQASGYWGWHPIRKTYIWHMHNDWGYPQEGTATYDDAAKSWTMNYKGIGLDGTDSWGRYVLTWVDDDTIEWSWTEWADAFRLIKKVEMTGAYKRK
jgi:hypothetical protein